MKNNNERYLIKAVKIWPLILILILSSCGKSGNSSEGKSTDVPSMAIHEAVFTGNMKEVKQHIAAETDLNVKDDFGSTPLTIASIFGKTEVALELIKAGVDIEMVSADGSTPLHTAAFFGRTEIVRSLLEKAANTTARNSFGATALESVTAPFDEVKEIYDQMSRDLGPMGLKLDYKQLADQRIAIAAMIRDYQ